MAAIVLVVAESKKAEKSRMKEKAQGRPMKTLRVTNHMAMALLTPAASTTAAKTKMKRINSVMSLPQPAVKTALMGIAPDKPIASVPKRLGQSSPTSVQP